MKPFIKKITVVTILGICHTLQLHASDMTSIHNLPNLPSEISIEEEEEEEEKIDDNDCDNTLNSQQASPYAFTHVLDYLPEEPIETEFVISYAHNNEMIKISSTRSVEITTPANNVVCHKNGHYAIQNNLGDTVLSSKNSTKESEKSASEKTSCRTDQPSIEQNSAYDYAYLYVSPQHRICIEQKYGKIKRTVLNKVTNSISVQELKPTLDLTDASVQAALRQESLHLDYLVSPAHADTNYTPSKFFGSLLCCYHNSAVDSNVEPTKSAVRASSSQKSQEKNEIKQWLATPELFENQATLTDNSSQAINIASIAYTPNATCIAKINGIQVLSSPNVVAAEWENSGTICMVLENGRKVTNMK